eukprot:148026-Pyramimonas_sp.AAC.1
MPWCARCNIPWSAWRCPLPWLVGLGAHCWGHGLMIAVWATAPVIGRRAGTLSQWMQLATSGR